MDGPASRRKFVFGIVFLGASRWPPQIVIRYAAIAMTIEKFIATTKAIIAEDGLDGYLPTLRVKGLFAVRYHVLTDVPPGVDVELFARDWASHVAKWRKDYFLAFRLDESHIKVVSRHSGVLQEQTVAVGAA